LKRLSPGRACRFTSHVALCALILPDVPSVFSSAAQPRVSRPGALPSISR
jgi:hypothetical protein